MPTPTPIVDPVPTHMAYVAGAILDPVGGLAPVFQDPSLWNIAAWVFGVPICFYFLMRLGAIRRI